MVPSLNLLEQLMVLMSWAILFSYQHDIPAGIFNLNPPNKLGTSVFGKIATVLYVLWVTVVILRDLYLTYWVSAGFSPILVCSIVA